MVNREFLRVATELVNFASGSYQVINIESVYQNARRGTKVKGWVGGVYWDIWLWHIHGINAPCTLIVPQNILPNRGPRGEATGGWGPHNSHNIIYVGNDWVLDPPHRWTPQRALDYARLKLGSDARFRYFSESRRAISQYYASAISQLTRHPYNHCDIPLEKQSLDHFLTTGVIPDDFHHSRFRARLSAVFRGGRRHS